MHVECRLHMGTHRAVPRWCSVVILSNAASAALTSTRGAGGTVQCGSRPGGCSTRARGESRVSVHPVDGYAGVDARAKSRPGPGSGFEGPCVTPTAAGVRVTLGCEG